MIKEKKGIIIIIITPDEPKKHFSNRYLSPVPEFKSKQKCVLIIIVFFFCLLGRNLISFSEINIMDLNTC